MKTGRVILHRDSVSDDDFSRNPNISIRGCSMEFQIREQKGVVIIELVGEMVGGPDAVRLTETLHGLVDQKKVQIVVNLCSIKWMNSSGLGILIGGLNTVRNSGGDLKLCCLSEKTRHLLKITQLDRVFEIFDQEEEAIEKYF